MSVLSCPVCAGAMREIGNRGVMVDVCSQCRGVWLDRGELEKLSALMAEQTGFGTAKPAAPQGYHQTAYRSGYDDDDDDDRRRQGYGAHGQRKPSTMSRLLEFFD